VKNRLLPVVLWAVFACVIGNVAVGQSGEPAKPAQGEAPLQFVSLPYLQNPLPDSMTVMWLTNQPCLGWVEYGEGAALDQKAFSSHNGLVDANEVLCKIPLTGLKPGTTYSYRAVSKAISRFLPYEVTFGETKTSETYQFTTPGPNADAVSFVVFNDLHSSRKMRDLVFPIAKKESFNLAFFNGDVMTHVDNRDQVVNHLVVPGAELCAGAVPFVLVRGNHDTRGGFARHLMEYVATPDDRFYFSFDWGPVHFVVLDLGEDKPDSAPVYGGLVAFDQYRDEETAWLQKEVESEAFKRAPFRVSLSHIPLFGNGDQEEFVKKWAALLNAGKIDLHISAHTHTFALIDPSPGEHDYPVIIGGAPDLGAGTLVRVKATRDQLDFTVTGDNGTALATRQIKRRGQ